jgi:phosphatidylserine/phosphatidylglycerophosphate/cardiolipin synthase-like enzyme
VADLELFTLAPGGQTVDEMAKRVAGFLSEARRSLDLALYDVRLPGPAGDLVADALREAAGRGVAVRIAYNADRREDEVTPPPSTKPELIEALPFPTKGIPGIPDLMHHKYVVRDGEAVWTGSTNWTTDSWTLQENMVAVARSADLAGAFTRNFEELWSTGDVSRSGREEPRPVRIAGDEVLPWFTPGQGEDLSHRIASAIGRAKRRVRIASPVLTAGPVIGTLAEVAAEGRIDLKGVVDRTQMTEVFHQWRSNGRSAWKIPIVAATLSHSDWRGKPSTPYGPDTPHDFMHAKVTVADDVVFAGSFNLSRSGEMNAENVLELHDPELAERMASFIDEIRARYEPMPIPDFAPGDARPTASPPARRPARR